MECFSTEITNLIEELGRLPGIGNKTAQRLAFHIIHMRKEQVDMLSNSIKSAKENFRFCKECFSLTD